MPWKNYSDYFHHRHTVVGTVKVAPEVWSPQLHNKRPVLVYLPPSYALGHRRYPVLYMHDGQNLFDDVTSFAGDWRVDETMEGLGKTGIEAIIVGIYNKGRDRINEYSPFVDVHYGGGKGDLYLSFIADTLKPMIDSVFRTLPQREFTGVLGSSMGGLISLYAFFEYSDIFGLAGVMSPSLWFADEAIMDYVERAFFVPGRLYMDVGTREYADFAADGVIRSRGYYASVRRMYRELYRKGYDPRRNLLYVEEKWAQHREAAWAARLPAALRFLIPEREMLPVDQTGGGTR